MKKTIIALMALAGIAQASTAEIQLLDKAWGEGYRMSIEDSVLTYAGNDWGENAIKLNFNTSPIVLAQNQVLTLNVTHNAGNPDNSFTIALENEAFAFVGGRSFKDTTYRVGITDEVGLTRGYVFSTTNNDADTSNIITEYSTSQGSDVTSYYKNLAGSTFSPNKTENDQLVIVPNSFTLTVGYDHTQNAFIGTMNVGNVSESILLGDTFEVNNIVATFVTNSTAQVTDMSLSIKTVPEPTTATLSLLALAGLAARRRRK